MSNAKINEVKNVTIENVKIEPISRRAFVDQLIHYSKLGLLSASGLYLLDRCTGSVPATDDLEPPFICLAANGCVTASTTSAPTITLVFSAYNPESGFTGYNVWYGAAATIRSEHSANSHGTVLNSTGSTSLSTASIGGTSMPSYTTSSTVNATVQITLTISNTLAGNSLFVTAYNTGDNLDSPLSNELTIV